jgi:DNA polymerase
MSGEPFTGNPQAPQVVVLDVETRSSADLKKVGAHRYAADHTTDVWCVAYAIDDQPVALWLPGDPVPPNIVAAAADPDCKWAAHNCGFECPMLRHILTPRYGWPEIPVERWRDTMVMALALALPAGLRKLATILHLKHQKGDDKVMHLMARPRKARAGEPPGLYWHDDNLERLLQLYAYCKQDVECERELFNLLPELPPAEQALLCFSEMINGRGAYSSGRDIETALAVTTAAEREVQNEIKQVTGGAIETTNQVEAILAWLKARGCELPDLQKGTLSHALRRSGLSPEVRRVIELRREAAHASAAKVQSLRAWRGVDGRVRGCFRFHGAATGRWSGTGPQLQNFRRESENTATKLEAVATGDIEVVKNLGAPIEVVGDITRALICAEPGKRLLVGDFSGIESRVLAWLAMQHDKVEQWKRFDQTRDPNDDPYVVIGRALGHPEETARAKGKICDLAFGYQGGRGSYANFATEDDIATEAEIEAFKQAWRDRHPEICRFWKGIERAAINALHRSPQVIHYGRLTLQCDRRAGLRYLFITPPVGRTLSYPQVSLIRGKFDQPAVMFMDNSLGQWAEANHGRGAYGGLFTENVVSAIARDLLAAAMLRLEAAGYPVVLHVHDEIVCELPEGVGTVAEFKALIEMVPDWAEGLPIAAKVRNGPRWAEVDVPVQHVAGGLGALPSKPKPKPAKHASVASAILPEPLPTNHEVFNRVVAWAVERENARKRKEAGQPWPWSDDPIIANYRFCNVERERDAGTIAIMRDVIEPFQNHPDLVFIDIVARLHNEPDCIRDLVAANCLAPFDPAHYRAVLEERQTRKPKANNYRYQAYKALMVPVALAGTPAHIYHATMALPEIWAKREYLRPRSDDTLRSFTDRLRECYGIDSFFAGQIAADLKFVEPLKHAADWWTFALPGPGSRPGLNRLRGRAPKTAWREWHWCLEIERLHEEIAPVFERAGLPRLHRQNLQSVCCEINKYEKKRAGEGAPPPYKPAQEKPSKTKPVKTEPKAPEIAATIAPAAPGPMAAELAIMAAAEALERKATPDQRTEAAEPETKQKAGTRSNGPGPRGDGYPHGERDTGTQADFYIYQHANGSYYLGVKRTSTKQFPQYHWTGQQWVKGLPKDFAKIPYRLPELLKAPRDAWVVIASGEKDANTAARLGFVATTNSGGEGKGQWTPELNAWFAGRKRVAIMEDNDATGKAHAIEVATALRDIVPDIRIIGFRELPTHGDLTDWIEADHSRGHAELLARIEGAQAATGYELIKASTITMRAVQWWWAGHLARGELEILTGQPDIGKSQVHCSYVAHMTTGRDWPDKTKGPPVCDVVMLTAEDNMAHTLCPRLAAAGADLDRVLILNKIRKDNRDRMFLLQEDLDVLARILAGNPAIGLVTLDPITAYMGGKVDSHRATDVRNQLGPLKELAERSNVAFSAITHPAKKPGPKALDHYIGSQAFIAAPRLGHICIPEFEDGEDGRPKATGRFLFATPKHNIYFAMPTLAYRLVSTSIGEIGISRVQWEEEVSVTADQALAATTAATKSKASDGVVTFLLDMLAGGPVPKKLVDERAAQRGFTADQLRRAREKAGIETFKETGKKDGVWFWCLAQPGGRRHENEGAA